MKNPKNICIRYQLLYDKILAEMYVCVCAMRLRLENSNVIVTHIVKEKRALNTKFPDTFLLKPLNVISYSILENKSTQ